MSDTEFKKFDSFARYTALVRLAQDAKTFPRQDGGEDVVVTFCDNSRINGTLDLWVDARMARHQADRAKKLLKGDEIQVEGKLRFKLQDDGKIRGKIYDATFASFVKLNARGEPEKAETSDTPAFQ